MARVAAGKTKHGDWEETDDVHTCLSVRKRAPIDGSPESGIIITVNQQRQTRIRPAQMWVKPRGIIVWLKKL